MNSTKNALCLFALLLFVSACTDDIEVDSPFEEAQPVVDAWITNAPQTQTINLTQTQDYFGNSTTPALTGAEVIVCQNAIGTRCFEFTEQADGIYEWSPSGLDSLGTVGEQFVLTITSGDKTFIATSRVNRVPAVDSISVQFEEQQLGLEEGLYAQVYARDLPGVGDRYLIRSTINDTLLNRPEELNVAFDAAFDGGTASDGINFILPIRFGINKLDDDGGLIPLISGDIVEVEIWSLEQAPFEFLTNAQEQILNGDNQLFSVPVVSTRGNVIDANTSEPVLGVFSVSAVSSAQKEVE